MKEEELKLKKIDMNEYKEYSKKLSEMNQQPNQMKNDNENAEQAFLTHFKKQYKKLLNDNESYVTLTNSQIKGEQFIEFIVMREKLICKEKMTVTEVDLIKEQMTKNNKNIPLYNLDKLIKKFQALTLKLKNKKAELYIVPKKEGLG